MRTAPALLLLLAAATPVLARDAVPVQVTAQVPLVALVDGPAIVSLAPGEERACPLQVRANVPWLLTVQSTRGETMTTPVSGEPGVNSAVVVTLRREAGDAGPPLASVTYTLTAR